MAESGSKREVTLSTGTCDIRGDSRADFIAGCYAGLRMMLPMAERVQGLAKEGLPEEGAGRSAEKEGVASKTMREAIERDKADWLIESEAEGDEAERAFQEVDRRGVDQPLVIRRAQFHRQDTRRQRRDDEDERRAGIGRGRGRDVVDRDYVLKVAGGRARISGRLLQDRRP